MSARPSKWNQLKANKADSGDLSSTLSKAFAAPVGQRSRLDSAGKHAPSLTSLKKYAEAVGCSIKIEFVP